MNLSLTQRKMGQTEEADASLNRGLDVAERLVRDLPEYPTNGELATVRLRLMVAKRDWQAALDESAALERQLPWLAARW